jgi:hypothetical protein
MSFQGQHVGMGSASDLFPQSIVSVGKTPWLRACLMLLIQS